MEKECTHDPFDEAMNEMFLGLERELLENDILKSKGLKLDFQKLRNLLTFLRAKMNLAIATVKGANRILPAVNLEHIRRIARSNIALTVFGLTILTSVALLVERSNTEVYMLRDGGVYVLITDKDGNVIDSYATYRGDEHGRSAALAFSEEYGGEVDLGREDETYKDSFVYLGEKGLTDPELRSISN